MSCRRRRGYRRFSTSAYRLLGDFEVAITGGVWVATGDVVQHKTIVMRQGQKQSRLVAWTFLNPQQQEGWRKLRW